MHGKAHEEIATGERHECLDASVSVPLDAIYAFSAGGRSGRVWRLPELHSDSRHSPFTLETDFKAVCLD